MTTALVTDRELAARYGKSLYFIQEQCRTKRWPHLRVGQSIRFTEAHVEAIDNQLAVDVATTTDALPAATSENPWGRKGRTA